MVDHDPLGVARQAVIVGELGRDDRLGARGEAGAQAAGSDIGDLDSELGDFGGQGLGQAFQGPFAGAIDAGAGPDGQARDRGDIDDPPGPAGAHGRQDGLQQGQRTDDIGLELGADLVERGLLDRPDQAVAGVVDQDVDLAGDGLGLGGAGFHGGLVGDVEDQGVAAQQLESVGVLGLAHRADDRVAARQGRQGDLAPEPAGDAGDQPGFGHGNSRTRSSPFGGGGPEGRRGTAARAPSVASRQLPQRGSIVNTACRPSPTGGAWSGSTWCRRTACRCAGCSDCPTSAGRPWPTCGDRRSRRRS